MDLFPFYSPLENCALITWKPFSVIVESRFKNTRFIPTPQFSQLSLGKESPYIFSKFHSPKYGHPVNMDIMSVF